MFRLTEPLSGQNTKHNIGTFNECTHYVCTHELKHVAEFLIFNIDYQYILGLLTD
jgi:hypothetical protein